MGCISQIFGDAPGVLKIQLHFLHVAPSPLLPGLDGAHDRVLGLMEMLRRVLAYGTVAAAYVSTDEAHAQMDPPLADLEALFTSSGVRTNVVNLVKVGTRDGHTVLNPTTIAGLGGAASTDAVTRQF